jgi:hypothetical protein
MMERYRFIEPFFSRARARKNYKRLFNRAAAFIKPLLWGESGPTAGPPPELILQRVQSPVYKHRISEDRTGMSHHSEEMSFGLSNYGERPCLCNNPQHVRRDARPFFGSVLSHVECLEPCAEDSTSSSQARLENSLLSRGASGRKLHDCRGSVVRVRMAVRWWKSSRDGDTTRTLASSALGVLVGVFGNDRLDPHRQRAREISYPRSDSQRGSCRLRGHIVGFRLGLWHCPTSEMLRNRGCSR